MGLPISILENILHNTTSKPGMPAIIDDYIIQIGDELVTIKELIDFWKVGHEKLKRATASMNEAIAITEKYLGGTSERSTEKEKKLSSEQKVEGLSPSKECGTEGNRPDNKKEAVQGSESTSQKPKRRGVRKPREQ